MSIFALVDCNNFYVSCERAFNIRLEGKPVIVLSNNDGCVVARSDEVKQLGIKRGMPVFQCRDLIKQHGIEVYSSNYTLYADMSRRVMDTLAKFSPEMEIYSIDEAFLNLNGFSPTEITSYAREIRQRVKQWTGIPVSVGIGPTKTLAKVAGESAKKDRQLAGVFDISAYSEEKIDALLSNTDVQDIWGIGSRKAQFLRQHQIYNAFQLKNASDPWIQKYLTIVGLRTIRELRGISCCPLEMLTPPKKAIISSKSFGRPVETLEELKEAVATYLARAAEKLRRQGSVVNVLQVFVQTSRFKEGAYSNHATARLPQATAFTPELVGYAHRCLERIFKPGYVYHKAGVMLTGIVPREQLQLSFFGPDPAKQERQQRLMEALDGLNGRWGRDTVKVAAAGLDRDWAMRRGNLSARFTTSWQDLPKVRAC